MNTVAIVQARMSSTRLPGKVLYKAAGRSLLALMLERVSRCRLVDALVVATSDDPSDDPIVEECDNLNVTAFRGSLEDVLDRYYQTARLLSPTHIVRLSADCPLSDPAIVDAAVRCHIEAKCEYTSNVSRPTFPHGLDVEVVTFEALSTAWREATLPAHREHVLPFVHSNAERFRIGSLEDEHDNSDIRLTVDYPEDYEVVRRVIEALVPEGSALEYADILECVRQHPEWLHLNARHARRLVSATAPTPAHTCRVDLSTPQGTRS